MVPFFFFWRVIDKIFHHRFFFGKIFLFPELLLV